MACWLDRETHNEPALMKHAKRLIDFWNWLPAFRAVAETQHLPTASQQLHITPSALSRTVRLLEDSVQQPLFERRGRRLVLSPAGEVMLQSVRKAMRVVHEGLMTLEGTRFLGPVNISAPGPFVAPLVLPALTDVISEHPTLTPNITSAVGEGISQGLRQGQLDIALTYEALATPDLHIESLMELAHDVYCSADHPLAGTQGDIDKVSEAVFVAPVSNSDGTTPDAWPDARPRRIGMRVSQMHSALDAVKTGRFVAVLPSLAAHGRGLVPLKIAGINSTTLYMLHRPTLDLPGRVEMVAQGMRDVASRLG